MKTSQSIFDETTSDSTWTVMSESCDKFSSIHTVEQFYAMHGIPEKKSTKFKIRYARKMVKNACDLDHKNHYQSYNEKVKSDVQWVSS